MALLDDLAVVKLLPDAALPLEPRMVIFHTMVGSLRGTDAHFRNSSAKESHFGVGGTSDDDLDGVIWQWVDTGRRADANRNAYAFAISIETSDGGDENQPWSARQIDSLVALTRRLCELHGIPARVVSTWDDPLGGLGWHVMFGAPGPWTPVAKSCPGPVRLEQLKTVVFPQLGIRDFLGPEPASTTDDMLIYEAVDSIWLLHRGTSHRFHLPSDVGALEAQGVRHTGELSPAFHDLFEHVG
jgi:hypothetical protein